MVSNVNDKGIVSLITLTLTFLKTGKLPPNDVMTALISKGLGLGIVAGSTLVKIPQIARVIKAGSAEGLSPISFELETLGLVSAATYGWAFQLAFSAYGETLALILQNIILLIYVYRYQRRSIFRYFILFSLLLAWIGLYTGGYISDLYLESLFDINSLVLLASRVPQILQNYATGSTGQLSVITYFLNFAGSAARILTTLNEENAGTSMLRGAILSTLLNGIMLGQIVRYGNKREKQD